MTAKKIAERDAARASLRDLFPVGATVQTKMLHVSRSGMLRSFAVLVPENGTVQDVSGLVARAIGGKLHQATGGVAMGGCGMDMGYALAYSLGRALYSDAGTRRNPEGRPPFLCTGARRTFTDEMTGETHRACPSNDHVNDRASDYGYTRVHSDSGYSLNHRHV